LRRGGSEFDDNQKTHESVDHGPRPPREAKQLTRRVSNRGFVKAKIVGDEAILPFAPQFAAVEIRPPRVIEYRIGDTRDFCRVMKRDRRSATKSRDW
jgi:hypothetical protein